MATEPQVVEVGARERIGTSDYFRVSFFGSDAYLRMTETGSVVKGNQGTAPETSWINFAAAQGQTFTTSIENCTREGRIESTEARVSTALGDFNNALHIVYTASCADAGITEQYWVPYVGLVRHVTTSIAGPVQYDLVYVRSGATTADARQLAFSMALDARTYTAGENARAMVRLTLRNTLAQPLVVNFPSGQSYDLKIYNDRGEGVYTWSADKLFIQVYRTESIGPGERNFAFSVPLSNLPAGRYLAEAYLTTDPREFSATVGFEIVR